jgi:alkylation response protein AidB-like acyl-CoA dehydrogenase
MTTTAPSRSPVRHPIRLTLDDDQRRLQFELREFLDAELPEEFRRTSANPDYLPRDAHSRAVIFCRALHERGWFVPHWPDEFEGGGRPIIEQVIIREELAYAGAPLVNSNGVNMLAPVLFQWGTDAQRARHLGPIARSEVMWAQGYSETEAGSDLASLRMTAERDGDAYILNGHKTWTSNGRLADWIFVLARSDPKAKPQAGISFLLVDMQSAGITMRPIRSITGYPTFAEEFFDGVRVPAENLVGAEHDGWRVAKALLNAERTNITRAAQAQRFYDELVEWMRHHEGTDRDLRRDPLVRDWLAYLAQQIAVGRALSYRIAHLQAANALTPAQASLSKLFWSSFAVELKDVGSRILGSAGLLLPEDADAAVDGHFSEGLLLALLHQIGGGTNEVQRNVIGETGLGLPREPRP